MKYASVCSGVEAASLAWMPLGWEAAWFSEIEPFPCAVLKERFPNVPNLGDMTKIEVENLENGDQRFRNANGADVFVPGGVDLLVGGTPCQGFSVAGKQGGLDDERSVLCLTFTRLLESMRPQWFVWENVPGVFSTNGGEDFKAFLREIDEIGYSCAWRVLDAQYVRVDGYPRAVPQRRRRVFVVGHFGSEWEYPASVLFEPDCLQRNTPPRRIKGQGFTADVKRSVGKASTLTYKDAATFWNGNQYAESLTCTSDRQLMPDKARLQCVITPSGSEIADTLDASYYKGVGSRDGKERTVVLLNDQGGSVMQIENDGNAGTRRANTHGNEQIVCDAAIYDSRGNGNGDITPTLTGDHLNRVTDYTPIVKEQKGFYPNQFAHFKETAVTIGENIIGRQVHNVGNGVGAQEEVAYTQNTSGVMGGANHATVRRLLPVECERLMGFPDNWTRIPWKGKPEEECPDSPRYKACGNSMCVNVMRWIGMRIENVERKS